MYRGVSLYLVVITVLYHRVGNNIIIQLLGPGVTRWSASMTNVFWASAEVASSRMGDTPILKWRIFAPHTCYTWWTGTPYKNPDDHSCPGLISKEENTKICFVGGRLLRRQRTEKFATTVCAHCRCVYNTYTVRSRSKVNDYRSYILYKKYVNIYI